MLGEFRRARFPLTPLSLQVPLALAIIARRSPRSHTRRRLGTVGSSVGRRMMSPSRAHLPFSRFPSALALSSSPHFPSRNSYPRGPVSRSHARATRTGPDTRERFTLRARDRDFTRLCPRSISRPSHLRKHDYAMPSGVRTSEDGLRTQQDKVSALARPADISGRIPRVCLTFCTWVALAPATWLLGSLVVLTPLQYLRHGS